jgi:hypothetical protein
MSFRQWCRDRLLIKPLYHRGHASWHDPDSLNPSTRLLSRRQAKLTGLGYLHLAIAIAIPFVGAWLSPLSVWLQSALSLMLAASLSFYAWALDEQRRLHDKHFDVVENAGRMRPP